MIAGILMVLTGCFRNVEAAYKTINWESIVLIAAMLPMSLALEKTGGAEFISNSLVNGLGSYGPLALMAGIYFTTSLMTMFISNTATAVLLAPIALQSALQIGVSPVPFLFAVTLGASMCFASPFSTPPNALVMPAANTLSWITSKVGFANCKSLWVRHDIRTAPCFSPSDFTFGVADNLKLKIGFGHTPNRLQILDFHSAPNNFSISCD